MTDPDIQTPKDSHLVVEQGLFSRSSQATPPSSIPSATEPVTDAVYENQAPSIEEEVPTSRFPKINLFWVLLIPMVIIEIVLLIMVILN